MKTPIKTTIIALAVATWLLSVESGWAFYNPQTGRWLSRDPATPSTGTGNACYVRNDPTDSIDVLGLYQRIETTWKYGVGETWNGRPVIGPGTGKNGLTISEIDLINPNEDISVSVTGRDNCNCVLTWVNLTAIITVFTPLPGDQIYHPLHPYVEMMTATGTQTANIQEHESGHVYASQRAYDTLGPRLENSCRGKDLVSSQRTEERCRARWTEEIRNHLRLIQQFVSTSGARWHYYLGLYDSGNANYDITTDEWMAWVRLFERDLVADTSWYPFCDGMTAKEIQ